MGVWKQTYTPQNSLWSINHRSHQSGNGHFQSTRCLHCVNLYIADSAVESSGRLRELFSKSWGKIPGGQWGVLRYSGLGCQRGKCTVNQCWSPQNCHCRRFCRGILGRDRLQYVCHYSGFDIARLSILTFIFSPCKTAWSSCYQWAGFDLSDYWFKVWYRFLQRVC